MAEYKKFVCALCGYNMVSRAVKPRCTKCNSKRMNNVDSLTGVSTPQIKENVKQQIEETKVVPESTEKPQNSGSNVDNDDIMEW